MDGWRDRQISQTDRLDRQKDWIERYIRMDRQKDWIDKEIDGQIEGFDRKIYQNGQIEILDCYIDWIDRQIGQINRLDRQIHWIDR